MTNNHTTAQLAALATINSVITGYGYKPLRVSAIDDWGLHGEEEDTDLIQWANDYVGELDTAEAEAHDDTPSLDTADHNYEMNGSKSRD